MSKEFDLLSLLPLTLIVNWFVVLFLAGYVFFSFLVIRQVAVMCSVVESGINVILKLLAQLLFLAGLLLLLIALAVTIF